MYLFEPINMSYQILNLKTLLESSELSNLGPSTKTYNIELFDSIFACKDSNVVFKAYGLLKANITIGASLEVFIIFFVGIFYFVYSKEKVKSTVYILCRNETQHSKFHSAFY